MNDRAVLIWGAEGFLGRDLVTRCWNAGMKVYGTAPNQSARPAYIPLWPGRGTGEWQEPPEDLRTLVMAAGPGPGLATEQAAVRHLQDVRNVLAWARHYGVQRVVFVSVLAAAADGAHPLQRMKAQAESMVEHSG
ncbi:MAG: NAD-dependent epimerase/dehydratase family protein, partial [Clostridia bacterium]